ncbi:UBC-like protein [Massarina eburnea CBS 473.64]|uniref:UBC-like protein n=1 Tax=Massarina eburnea CBS 473.64 TaxID=1395130 RepID=A0A6A6RZH7_9PLEO|nr:UBC-like protein [Massarina eburnea CBS 473.64]
MNSKSLRRLAADHGSLQTAGLPPNYLFPPAGASDPYSDLTSLDILLAGPVGTPYVNGVWRLHLDIPPTYPTAPPTATFRTPLWHPNIDEKSGAVCVETLKRDWSSSLKLRDVLVTISCLLIQPNPASALNEDAGKLASEDWDSFCRRATLMTKIHAAVPASMAVEVKEAQSRGEEKQEKGEALEAEAKVNGKGKAKLGAKSTPTASKLKGSSAEDEENLKSVRVTVGAESDPEDDWIPGPIEAPKTVAKGRDNVFGIRGLEDQLQLDSPGSIRSMRAEICYQDDESENPDESDPFITVSSKRTTAHQQQQPGFGLHAPASTAGDSNDTTNITNTPDLLKFSHQNPFSAIQLNNQSHPLIKEFSWSWTESETLHGSGLDKDAPSREMARKRMGENEFVEKQRWEMKKFKRAGYDLKRYNRGDFGPRTGIARL